MNGLLNQLTAHRLKDIDFDAYQECENLVKPRLTNLELLPLILEDITRVYPISPENSAFILAVVYYLFAPYKLYYQNVRMQNGIRKMVCKHMNWNDPPVCNYYGAILTAYYKGERWAAKVNELGDELYRIMKDFN